MGYCMTNSKCIRDGDAYYLLQQRLGALDNINLEVVFENEDIPVVRFQINKQTPLKILMTQYCQKKNFLMINVGFRFGMTIILETDTAYSLRMGDGDTINVFHQ